MNKEKKAIFFIILPFFYVPKCRIYGKIYTQTNLFGGVLDSTEVLELNKQVVFAHVKRSRFLITGNNKLQLVA